MMARRQSEPVHTFAVGVEEQSFNELPYAKLVADRYGTRHHEACAQADLIADLPRMIWHLDEPSDPIAACMFYAARLAAQHVKVVLGGDGGDELFGGFDRYLGLGKVDLYSRVPALLREQVIGSMIARIPENFAYKSVTQKIRWVQQLAALREHGERYAEATFFFVSIPRRKKHCSAKPCGPTSRATPPPSSCSIFTAGRQKIWSIK